jgi:hypothetical protein
MLEAIEKLLILQDRDPKIHQISAELAHIPYGRQDIQNKHEASSKGLEEARLSLQKIESEKKRLQLDVEDKKKLIEKYSVQQFQTKKNEEYRALAKEIDTCKRQITEIEDQELDLMEKEETARKKVAAARASEAEAKKITDSRLHGLDARARNLNRELSELNSDREDLASVVDDSLRNRYERLFKSKGTNVIVGIQHGVCGGCHMQLSRQILVSCRAEQEIMTCDNCGRILYYTRDMDLASAD